MTEIAPAPMLDGLVTILDEIRCVDAIAFHEPENSVAIAQLGTHVSSPFNDVWGEITGIVWDHTREIRQEIMSKGDEYNKFREPHLNIDNISTFNPSITDDFVALSLHARRGAPEPPDLYRFNLKVAYFVSGKLRIQSTISLDTDFTFPFLSCLHEELSEDSIQQAESETIDLIAERQNSDRSS